MAEDKTEQPKKNIKQLLDKFEKLQESQKTTEEEVEELRKTAKRLAKRD